MLGPPLADDLAAVQAYPVAIEINEHDASDAPIRATRGAILQPSRFHAINSVFGHLRPGERNVLDDLSPIL
jgi:hypothetical protein